MFDLAIERKAGMPSARLRMLLSTIPLTEELHSWVAIAHPEG